MSDPFVPPTSHEELMARIATGWEELQSAFADVPDKIANLPGREAWSAQDQITHIAAWERSTTDLLRGENPMVTMDLPAELWATGDIDAMNAILQARTANWSRSQAMAEAEAAHAALVIELEKLTWDDLHRPRSHFNPELPDPAESPEIIGWVYRDSITHYPDHLDYLHRVVSDLSSE